ncbi:hypothetical protein KKF61_09245, partial [Patescibacteria group bacterium]|nr:hypothetical protein [Patescibacteria group bacterium]
IDLPADYTDFGSSYAASFSGDGRSVVICDTDDAIGVVGDGETSGLIDIDPSGTGSQSIIDITPTAGIGAGSLWYGIKLSLADLDPATGVGSHVYGNYVDMTSMASVDGDVSAYGYYFAPCQADNSIGYYSQVPELDAGLMLTAFKTYHIQILSTTATYRGLHIDWDQLTRDANAPVIEGIRVEIAPDLSNFGTSFAGYFSGDGRTVTICDTTYALDISGAVRTNTQIASTLAIGTSPFAVTSTTVNTNLNADLWDGYQFTDYLDQAVKQASSPTFVGLSLSGAITGVTTFSAGTATFEVAADGYITTYPGMVIGADNYVLTYDHALGTLVLEVAAAGVGESLAATLAIGNETDGVSIIIDSAGDLLVYSDDKVTLKASIDGATGNTIVAGTFTAGAAGFDIDASGNIVDCGSIAMGGALTGVTTMSISDTVTMSEAVAQIVHSGATGMVVASTSGYVEIESVRFTGSTITGVGSMSLVGPITIGGDVVISHPAANSLLFSAGDFLGFALGTYINEFSIDGALAGNSDDALPTEQAVKTYVATHAAIAAAHHPAPSDTAFAASWDAVTTIAPSKNAVYDRLKQAPRYASATQWEYFNGAVWGVGYGYGIIALPLSDANARFTCIIHIPDDYPGTSGYVKVHYMMSVANQAYSGLWYISSFTTGEAASSNILNGSTGYDFAASTAVWKMQTNSINMAGIAAGETLGIRFDSDALNSTALYIVEAWLQVEA